MSKIKLARNKDSHWWHSGAERQNLAENDVSKSNTRIRKEEADIRPSAQTGRRKYLQMSIHVKMLIRLWIRAFLCEESIYVSNLKGVMLTFFFLCMFQQLTGPVFKMKLFLLLVFGLVLPVTRAQVPHWGPCPEPAVQSAFSLKQVTNSEGQNMLVKLAVNELMSFSSLAIWKEKKITLFFSENSSFFLLFNQCFSSVSLHRANRVTVNLYRWHVIILEMPFDNDLKRRLLP